MEIPSLWLERTGDKCKNSPEARLFHHKAIIDIVRSVALVTALHGLYFSSLRWQQSQGISKIHHILIRLLVVLGLSLPYVIMQEVVSWQHSTLYIAIVKSFVPCAVTGGLVFFLIDPIWSKLNVASFGKESYERNSLDGGDEDTETQALLSKD